MYTVRIKKQYTKIIIHNEYKKFNCRAQLLARTRQEQAREEHQYQQVDLPRYQRQHQDNDTTSDYDHITPGIHA